MYVLDYSPEVWLEAEQKAELLPVYTYSQRGKIANEIGTLGQCVVMHWLQPTGIFFKDESLSERRHDIRLPDLGQTLEVKTKDRTVIPRPHYACSVSLYNHDFQRPTYYVFVSLLRDKNIPKGLHRFRQAYLLGGITVEAFDTLGKDWQEGEIDPENGTQFCMACRNVCVHQLLSPDELLFKLQMTEYGLHLQW